MFLLVTVVCVWLGLQVQWLRDRGEALRWLEGNGGNFAKENGRFRWVQPDGTVVEGGGINVFDHAKAPWIIRLMGAETIYWLNVPRDRDGSFSKVKLDELSELFPEAEIRLMDHRASDGTQSVPATEERQRK